MSMPSLKGLSTRIFGRLSAKPAFFALLGLGTLLVPLFVFTEVLFHDWTYFNGLSLFSKSLVLRFQSWSFHDPWRCGGLNLLANPQHRMFSPLFILDLTLPSHLANVLSLGLHASVGAFGFYTLARREQISELGSRVAATLWLTTSYFALHSVEGHIVYGCLQLLPWVVLCARFIDERKMRLGLALLLALFLLEGGIYTFVFSVHLILTLMIFGLIDIGRIRVALKDFIFTGATAAFGLLYSAPKWYPLLRETSGRRPVLENLQIDPLTTLKAFLSPVQRMHWKASDLIFGYHEISCSLSLVGLAIFILSKPGREFFKKNLRWVGFALLWLWVGTGFGGELNPWNLVLEKIPFLNQAHIQMRWLLLFFFAVIFVISQRIDPWLARTRPPTRKFFFVLLAIEFLNARGSPYVAWIPKAAEQWEGAWPTAGLIDRDNVVKTIDYGDYHLYIWPHLRNQASQTCYEPSAPRSPVLSINHPNYRGEVYLPSASPFAQNSARMTRYTPGHIELEFQPPIAAGERAIINTHDLGYWRVTDAHARIVSQKGERLELEVAEKSPKLVLEFRPPYVRTIVGAWIFGALGFFGLFAFLRLSDNRRSLGLASLPSKRVT